MPQDKIKNQDLEPLEELTDQKARAAAEKRRRKAEMEEARRKEQKRRELLLIAGGVLLIVFVAVISAIIIREVKAYRQEKEREAAWNTAEENLTLRPDEDGSNAGTAQASTASTTEEQTQKEQTEGSDPSGESVETSEKEANSTETAVEDTTAASTDAPEPAAPSGRADADTLRAIATPSWVTEDFLSISEYSRPGYGLTEVNNIVVHYVGNPGTSAAGNREYFENLSNPELNPAGTGASSHYVVGLEGEIVQCIPIYEVAFANYPRNYDTISIEVCHPDESGKFNETTYWTLVRLCAYLLEQTGMDPEQLIRHYDVSGKLCPVYYVEHPEEWSQFKNNVRGYMAEHPDIRNEFP